MTIKLHKNATTTPATRTYIRESPLGIRALARELGLSEGTVRKWKRRQDPHDRSHTRHDLGQSTTPAEEEVIKELRTRPGLPLDDITEVMRRCLNPQLSRGTVHRCLRRHGLSSRALRPSPAQAGSFEETTCGFIHLDVKHLPKLEKKASYVFVAVDRATRYVYAEVHRGRSGATAASFLERFLGHFPHGVHTILTGNGSEFTDRYAVLKPGKPKDKPSGEHPVDVVCARRGIAHRLTRPFRPQTNGMAERFNRRLEEHLASYPKQGPAHRQFRSVEERTAYVLSFVENYNRTRLRCLGYRAPTELLHNHAQHNTKAGRTLKGRLATRRASQ